MHLYMKWEVLCPVPFGPTKSDPKSKLHDINNPRTSYVKHDFLCKKKKKKTRFCKNCAEII